MIFTISNLIRRLNAFYDSFVLPKIKFSINTDLIAFANRDTKQSC